jgi:hypothetical protein
MQRVSKTIGVVGIVALVAVVESSAQPANIGNLTNDPKEAICTNALNREGTAWDQRPNFSKYVAEAGRRGLTIDACRKLVAQPTPAWGPDDQSPWGPQGPPAGMPGTQGIQQLPQTQMAAAALVMRTVLLIPTWNMGSPEAGRIQIIDDKTAHMSGSMVQGPDEAVVVEKLSDCRFEAVKLGSTNKLAVLNLGVLSSEYRQWNDRTGTQIMVIGTGKGPALCATAHQSLCFNNLTLGLGGKPSGYIRGEEALRTLKAVTFLQKYCPPQQLGF